MVGGGGGVIVVKPLFPPEKKKEVNDTLELLTRTRHSSLSFMEGRCDELFSVRETTSPSPFHPHPTKTITEAGGGVIAVIIITKYIIKPSVWGAGVHGGGAGWVSTHPPTRRKPVKMRGKV